MSNPVEGTTYTRVHPDQTWHAQGRPDQAGSVPTGTLFPASDQFPQTTLYPGG